jgi:hypothetical protein
VYEYINTTENTTFSFGPYPLCPGPGDFDIQIAPEVEGVTFCIEQLSQGTIDAFNAQGLTLSEGVCSTPTPTPTRTPTPTPTRTITRTPTPTRSITPTISTSPFAQIYTHGAVLGSCSDYCFTNYNITTLTGASTSYAALIVGSTIFDQGGLSGYVAYSDVSTDTSTGPFRIAEIDSNGVVQAIFTCIGFDCEPL